MPEVVQQTPPRRSTLRHWMLRLFVAGFTLLLVVIVTAQIVLSTTIPKQIVIAQVQRIMGLRITAESVSTGWFGHTILRNVTVSLPLAQQPFLQMPELHVSHTILPILIITQSVDLKSLTIDRPRLLVTQDQAGRWNLQDVAQILLRIGGSGQPAPGTKSTPIVLPRVAIRDGEIDVKDNAGRSTRVSPFSLTGQPDNALVWQYNASCKTPAGASIQLAGRVAPNDNFAHEVDFDLSNLAPLAAPWVPRFDPAAAVKGQWTGAQSGDGVAGRVRLNTLKYQAFSAENGDVSIVASASAANAIVSHCTVHLDQRAADTVSVTGGAVHVDATAANLNGLELSGFNGRALLNGNLDFSNQSAGLHADWQSVHPAPAITSSGSIDATLATNWPDQRIIKVNLSTTGTVAAGGYNAAIQLTGNGKSWDNANWVLTAPTLDWSGKQSLALDHLIAHITAAPGQITLSDVSIPGASSVIGGGGLRFDARHPSLDSYNWWLYLQGQNWAIPDAAGASFAFGLNTWGDPNQIRLQQAFAVVGRMFAGLDGYYRFAQPKPVDVNLGICELNAPIDASPDILHGNVRGEGVLAGTIVPLSLDASGQVHGDNIVFDNRPPQQIAVKCTAGLHDGLFALDTEELSLFGGEWSLHAQVPARDTSHGNAPDMTLHVRDLPLKNIAALIHQTGVSGLAQASIEVDVDQLALDQITGTGHVEAKDVRAGKFKADSTSANISLRNGRLELSPIELKLADGTARATVSANLNNPHLLTTSLDASRWPIDAGPIHAAASASTHNLQIDAKSQTANGRINFSAAATFQHRPLLTANGALSVAGRIVSLQNLKATVLDGDASGSATVDIDHPMASRGTLRWDALNLAELSDYDNVYQTAKGFITGRADLAPTTDPRALGPLMLDIACVGQSARYRNVTFTETHLPIYFDADPDGYRAVLDGGKIEVAGGSIGLFARASMHAQNTLSTQVQLTLADLDLEQILHAADKSEADKLKSYPGKLAGLITIVGDPRDKMQLFGQASLQIHDSDLGSFGPFSALYDTMHLGGTWGKKIGEGSVDARYDNDTVIVTSLKYYNRGIDAYGLATIGNISHYPDCPLSGELVGTYRPLKNINLPFFADADKIFSVLQTNLTSIVIGGTLEPNKQTYIPESASAIGDAMRTFLLGDVPQPK